MSVMSIALLMAAAQEVAPPRTDTLPKPTVRQLAWHDLELGMFIHLAPQTWQDSESDDLSTPLSAIDPAELDTDQWVAVARSMGANYIVFVAKHEGGFCWWPTQTTDFCIRKTPWRGGTGDLLGELERSCRENDMKLGIYISPRDAKHGIDVGGKAKTPEEQEAYAELFRIQLAEVLGGYGEVIEVWFDGSLVFDVGDVVERFTPEAVVFQGPQASIRWVGNEDGIAPYPAWNAVKHGVKPWGHYTAADGTPDGDRWLPNECDARMRSTWFWKTNNQDTLKSVEQLMDMYEQSVGHGAVLLLNHTPDRTGRIPELDARRAAEFGAEIRRRYGVALADTSGKGPLLSLQPSAPVRVDRIVTMEDIAHGERVRKYVIEAQVDGVWRELCSGSAIGHKKIDRIAPVTVSAVRWRCLESVGEPLLRRFALYDTGAR